MDIALPAFAETIGAAICRWDDDRPILAIDYSDQICGNPGMFHGGAVGGLLAMAAVATLQAELGGRQSASRLIPVSSTVEFLRAAREARAFVAAEIVKSGRRFANLQAWLWQDSREKPVATAIVNILIQPGDK